MRKVLIALSLAALVGTSGCASLTGKKDGFGVAGARGGTVELDNITVWSVKPEANPQWPAARARFPVVEPAVVKQKPEKKAK